MCLHHVLYHTPCNHYTSNTPLSTLLHCYSIDYWLWFYDTQPDRMPLQIPDPIKIPEHCPINWDGELSSPIGGYRKPPPAFQASVPTPNPSLKNRARKIMKGEGSSITCPWGPERVAAYQACEEGSRRVGNIVVHNVLYGCGDEQQSPQCRFHWPDEGENPHPSGAGEEAVAEPSFSQSVAASERGDERAINFLASRHLPAPKLPSIISPTTTYPATAPGTTVPSPILPYARVRLPSAESRNGTPPCYQNGLPTPDSAIISWTGGVPWLTNGFTDGQHLARVQQQEQYRPMLMSDLPVAGGHVSQQSIRGAKGSTPAKKKKGGRGGRAGRGRGQRGQEGHGDEGPRLRAATTSVPAAGARPAPAAGEGGG